MSADATKADQPKIHPDRLFALSCISLIAAAFVFSIRNSIIPDLGPAMGFEEAHRQEMVNGAAGAAFLGFALTVFVGSPACDWIGMGRLLFLAGLLHLGGVVATIFAPQIAQGQAGYWVLYGTMFTVGLAHGLVEAVINPLAATLYPDNKTHKLNVLHAWWPGGLTLGSAIAYGIGTMGGNWQVKEAVILIPVIAYLILLIGQKFPATERVASGVSNADMLKGVLNPIFLVLLLAMVCTATSELAPNQLLETLSKTVGVSGTILLGYVSLLMFGMRFFAGSVAHKFSPLGMMLGSCVLAGVGLLLLSFTTGPVMAFVSATIFAVGVCYMWPTMLGISSELFPKGGALAMGLMGTFGNGAIYFALPFMGKVADDAKAQFLSSGVAADAAAAQAAPIAFRYTAVVPAIALVMFAIIFGALAAQGGYKAVQKREADSLQTAVVGAE